MPSPCEPCKDSCVDGCNDNCECEKDKNCEDCSSTKVAVVVAVGVARLQEHEQDESHLQLWQH
ncbi:unnamed protein product [Leptidea sinapis]|uniref:Metallothionein n=1 Tax=Leptidea sinapis TaxID=189913 RepID=A0A5E4QZ93_9NEOP|nr:unnamed protein product [Leptidea sinapis]